MPFGYLRFELVWVTAGFRPVAWAKHRLAPRRSVNPSKPTNPTKRLPPVGLRRCLSGHRKFDLMDVPTRYREAHWSRHLLAVLTAKKPFKAYKPTKAGQRGGLGIVFNVCEISARMDSVRDPAGAFGNTLARASAVGNSPKPTKPPRQVNSNACMR